MMNCNDYFFGSEFVLVRLFFVLSDFILIPYRGSSTWDRRRKRKEEEPRSPFPSLSTQGNLPIYLFQTHRRCKVAIERRLRRGMCVPFEAMIGDSFESVGFFLFSLFFLSKVPWG